MIRKYILIAIGVLLVIASVIGFGFPTSEVFDHYPLCATILTMGVMLAVITCWWEGNN